MSEPHRRFFGWFTKVAVSCGLLTVLAHSVPLRDGLQALAGVPAQAWAGNIVLVGLATALGAWRWHLASARTIPLKTCLEYYWMGIFYSFVLPGTMAGDVARTAALAAMAPQHRTTTLPMSVLLDRLGGLVTTVIVLLAAFVAFAYVGAGSSGTRLAACVLLCAGAAGAAWCPAILQSCAMRLQTQWWVPKWLRGMMVSAARLLASVSGRLWAKILVISLFIHVITGLSYAWSALATGVSAEIWRLALYYAVFNLAVMLPVTVAGAGLREQTAVWLLTGASSVALSWVILACGLFHAGIGAVLHCRRWFTPAPGSTP